MSKTAFYFRTQKEFNDLYMVVDEINKAAKTHLRSRTAIIRVKSKHLGDPRADNMQNKFIPYSKPSKKKFVGVIAGNKYLLKRAEIDPKRILKDAELERVQPSDNTPTYKGETSERQTHIKTHTQLRVLASIFDKQFGPGNWKIHGPKRMQDKLKKMEDVSSPWGDGVGYRKQHPKGIKVKLVVNQPNVDVKKYIFKWLLISP